jgi:thiol-disulfide isomerase/thioredoxin
MLGKLVVLAWLFVCIPARADSVDVTLSDLQGVPHKLSDYRGKWVVVNYWASWCPPCLEEIPDLIDFHERHKGRDAVVLGVDFEDIPLEQLRDFVDTMSIPYTILKERPAARTALGPVPGLPTSFIVSPDGRVAARNVGPVNIEAIEKLMRDYGPAHKTRSAGAAASAAPAH